MLHCAALCCNIATKQKQERPVAATPLYFFASMFVVGIWDSLVNMCQLAFSTCKTVLGQQYRQHMLLQECSKDHAAKATVSCPHLMCYVCDKFCFCATWFVDPFVYAQILHLTPDMLQCELFADSPLALHAPSQVRVRTHTSLACM